MCYSFNKPVYYWHFNSLPWIWGEKRVNCTIVNIHHLWSCPLVFGIDVTKGGINLLEKIQFTAIKRVLVAEQERERWNTEACICVGGRIPTATSAVTGHECQNNNYCSLRAICIWTDGIQIIIHFLISIFTYKLD